RGAEVVLGGACALGLDPVVYVSSYVALLPGDGELRPDSPVGRPPTAYARSKAQAEEVARALQAGGAPVTIVYPGMVWGPHDPCEGESTLLARDLLAGRIPVGSPGAVPVTDVRDLAAAIAAAVEPGRGPRRYLVAGELLPLAEVMRTVAAAGGRRPPRGVMPAPLVLAAGRVCDALQPLVRGRLPLGRQGPWTALHARPLDTTATRRDLGVAFRPATATLADTVGWLQGERPATAAEAAA
ncbi:MAG TPA: NAD-dependent epimerase/dehydratase family protein, partial [Thermodesulfobacteriota bacterium]